MASISRWVYCPEKHIRTRSPTGKVPERSGEKGPSPSMV